MSFAPEDGDEDDGRSPSSASRARRSSSAPAAAGRARLPARATTASTIGRSPERDIFLDDVTVSRRHAVLVQAKTGFTIEDHGQPERHVREPAARRARELEDGDEVQIGKYKLTFLER